MKWACLLVAAAFACDGGGARDRAPSKVADAGPADAAAALAPPTVPPPRNKLDPVDVPDVQPVIKNVDAPPALAAAPVWMVARTYITGATRGETPHTTYTLRRAGTQALLTVELRTPKRLANGNPSAEVLAWQTASVTQYLGTVEDKNKVVTIQVANGGETLGFRCPRRSVPVARADASRGRSPGAGECGDTGRWVPGTTTARTVLACEPDPRQDEFYEWATDWERIGFAPAPGVEWLHINDDCVIQGGGFRAVGKDGAIVRARQPERDSAPPKTAPSKTAPSKTAPSKTTPSKTAPSKTAPSRTAPSAVSP